jgi:hypothetical protein
MSWVSNGEVVNKYSRLIYDKKKRVAKVEGLGGYKGGIWLSSAVQSKVGEVRRRMRRNRHTDISKVSID